MKLRVIGVGSRWGDDAAGLIVATQLLRRPLPGVPEIVIRERPGLGLLDDLAGIDAAVVVDAMRGGGPPGLVRIVGETELGRSRRLSTHEIGVAASLALAGALGRPLPLLGLVGVEADTQSGPGLSAAVRRALPEACAAVERTLAALLGALGGDGRPLAWRDRQRPSSGPGELL